MQNFGNRRSVQKGVQNAGSNVLNITYPCTFLCASINRIHFNLIIRDVHQELSSLRMKNSNLKYKLNLRTDLFILRINQWGRIFIPYSIYRWYLFVLNFGISGKVTSLPKVIRYVKRSKYSFQIQRKTYAEFH